MVQYLEKIEKNQSYSTKIYQQIKSLIITGKLLALIHILLAQARADTFRDIAGAVPDLSLIHILMP